MYSHVFKELAEQDKPSPGKVIATNIVAFAGVSARYQNAVCALKKSVQNKQGIDPARAHYPDNPDIGRVLKSARSGKVCSSI